jgi:alkanesulfonate monooxygenase SsuD/methylene tetrahydromethanopterin reductase-like flavin-dependent oxidoreductase (luciferase family)
MAGTVDEISGGRLVLGLGAGWNEAEFRAFGIPFDHRVSRFEEAFDIIRRLLSGERVTSSGRFWRTEDAVLLPSPARRPLLMVGSTGERVLRSTLPHVDAWNTWYDGYGNTAPGFRRLNDRITQAAERAGRRPIDIRRSACILVAVDGGAGERPAERDVVPLDGSSGRVAEALNDLAVAGADEAILVLDPITEGTIRAMGPSIDALDG